MEREGISTVNCRVGAVRIGFVALLGLAALFPLVSSAQDSSGASIKVGVVDRKQVFDSYNKQRDEFAALETEVKGLQGQIDALSQQIEADKDKYEKAKEAGSMSDEQLDELEQKIKSDFRKYQTEFKRLQAEIDSKHARLIKKIKSEIDAVIAEIGVNESFDLVLEGDPKSGAGVLYFSSKIDITSKVVEALNSKAK